MSGARTVIGACLLALVGVLSPACSTRVDPGELVGTYSVAYPFGHGSLRLYRNGQYEQVLQIGGRTASAKGEWSHKQDGGRDMFFLEHCLSATNGFGKLNERWETPSAGACSPSVTRRFPGFGAIEITDDEDYSYRKTSSSPTASPSPSP